MTYIVEKKAEPPVVQDEDEDSDGEPVYDQNPVRVTCPYCGSHVITFIEHESSLVTYAVCLALLFVLNWAALCVVPVVYPLFKDVVHHCPRCFSVLANRSRVSISSFRKEVMSFRFGSCVVVLARKYVFGLLALATVISTFHMMRSSGAASTNVEVWSRGPDISSSWKDYLDNCGFKSYLGNPIHVTVGFDEHFKNKTVSWEGKVHHIENSLSFLWLNQRGAVFTRMDPLQFPTRPELADLVLLYNAEDEVSKEAGKLTPGSLFHFEATFIEVGRRGQPHVLSLWKATPRDAPAAAAGDPAAAAPAAPAGPAATTATAGGT